LNQGRLDESATFLRISTLEVLHSGRKLSNGYFERDVQYDAGGYKLLHWRPLPASASCRPTVLQCSIPCNDELVKADAACAAAAVHTYSSLVVNTFARYRGLSLGHLYTPTRQDSTDRISVLSSPRGKVKRQAEW
jgi:hypothetical protein